MKSIQDIRSTYSDAKRIADKKSNLWIYLVMRRISFLPTWICLKLGVSANQATIISIIIGLTGCMFLAIGGYKNNIIGALLVIGWSLFDCVDGNLARVNKSESKFGWLLDSITGFIMNAMLLISIGIGTYLNPDAFVDLILGKVYQSTQENIGFVLLIISAFGSLSSIFYALVIHVYNTIFGVELFKDDIGNKVTLTPLNKFLIIAKYFTGFGLIEPFILIASILNYTSFIILIFGLTNIIANFYILFIAICNSNRS